MAGLKIQNLPNAVALTGAEFMPLSQSGITVRSQINDISTFIITQLAFDFAEEVDDRVAALIQDGTGISWDYSDLANTLTATVTLAPFDTGDLVEGANLYYTQARFDSAFSFKDTGDLAEGVNFYYTEPRFDASFAGKNTGDLAEGSNLYFTDERVDDRVSALIQDSPTINWTYDDGLNILTAEFAGNVAASDVSILNIAGATYTDLQEFINLSSSAGSFSGGIITDSGGGQIDVSGGNGFLRILDDDVSDIVSFSWANLLNATIPLNTTRFVGVEYNAGAPQVILKTADVWDYDTEFPLGIVVNEGGTLYIVNKPWQYADSTSNIIERFDGTTKILRDERIGGIIVGETGTRNITLTAGQFLSCLSEFPITAKDTSGADSFDLYYRDGIGGWTLSAAQTQWNNSQYDDGSGILAAMTPDYYKSLWVYSTLDDKLIMLMGQAEYADIGTLLSSDSPPSTFPARVEQIGYIIGRIIVQEGAATAAQIQTSFANILSLGNVTDHGNLSGLSDDDHLQYHTDLRADAWLATKDTDELAEGAGNLYYTDARVNTLLATKRYISPAQAITAGGALTLAHGLGAVPTFWTAHLVNVIPINGYSIGDIATISMMLQDADRGVQIDPDATNLVIRFGLSAATFKVLDKATGNAVNILNVGWNIVFSAWVI